MNEVRIHLLEPYPLYREGIVAALRDVSRWSVATSAGRIADFPTSFTDDAENLVLMGLELPDGGGLEFIKRLKARFPAVRVLVVSAFEERLFAERALKAGACGYLMKSCSREELRAAVKTVLSDELFLSPAVSSHFIRRLARGASDFSVNGSSDQLPIERLTDRELEVFDLLGHGRSSKEIGSTLGMSHRTVDTHRFRIRKKLELRTSSELALAALHWLGSSRIIS